MGDLIIWIFSNTVKCIGKCGLKVTKLPQLYIAIFCKANDMGVLHK